MSIFDFAQFDIFYDLYSPLTPYGKRDKAEKKIFTVPEELNKLYSQVNSLISFLQEFPEKQVVLEYHMKRIPEVIFSDSEVFYTSEIFQIKKLIINYNEIVKNIPENLKSIFNIEFKSEKLLKLLSQDNDKNGETFYLSEKYSDRLLKIRSEIKEIDSKLKVLKKERLKEIHRKFGFDFRFNNFIVVKEKNVLSIDNNYIFKEAYDDENVVIKPVYQNDFFSMHNEKELLVKQEKEEEKKVLLNLSKIIIKEKANLESYIKSIKKFDTTCARADLAIKLELVKPEIMQFPSRIEVSEGVCLPVKNYCSELKTEYYPLDIEFDNRVIIISGSNMGGKTVVLKTIAFLQLLTQMGFFVTAKKYRTVIFKNLNYIGDLNHQINKGLSSYGMEIYALINTMKSLNEESLYLIDEFAGTTNSFEAEALLTSMLKNFGCNKNIFAFFSTHFMNLPDTENVSFYKMKGLNYKKFADTYKSDGTYSFVDRIRLINSYMIYEIEQNKNRTKSYDALKIAEILGLDKSIINYAKNILNKQK